MSAEAKAESLLPCAVGGKLDSSQDTIRADLTQAHGVLLAPTAHHRVTHDDVASTCILLLRLRLGLGLRLRLRLRPRPRLRLRLRLWLWLRLWLRLRLIERKNEAAGLRPQC